MCINAGLNVEYTTFDDYENHTFLGEVEEIENPLHNEIYMYILFLLLLDEQNNEQNNENNNEQNNENNEQNNFPELANNFFHLDINYLLY